MDTEYHIVHGRPVKVVPTQAEGAVVLKYSYDTGKFEHGMEYLTRVTAGGEDVDHVSKDEFIQHVEELRRKKFADREGGVYDLYAVLNGFEDIACEKGRQLTDDEKVLIESIKRKSFQWFESNPSN
ncbi:MAG: hypothetical protein AAFP03_04035 [Cyanobacteria bacterium J06598_3]